jgi:ABC-type sugar transport system permease subunit
LEGVGYARELFQVVVPMIWPTIAVGLLGSLTTMFTLYLQVDLLGGIHGSNINCESIAYLINSNIKAGTNLEWAAAIGVSFTIIALPFIIIVRKTLDGIGKYFEG